MPLGELSSSSPFSTPMIIIIIINYVDVIIRISYFFWMWMTNATITRLSTPKMIPNITNTVKLLADVRPADRTMVSGKCTITGTEAWQLKIND